MKYARYYKTVNPIVLAAKAADSKKASWIHGMGQGFADRFGAVALFTRSFATRFVGVTFDAKHHNKDPDLWTKRTEHNWVQIPKESIKGVAKHKVEKLVAIRKDWAQWWPQAETEEWTSAVLDLFGLTDKLLETEHFTVHIQGDAAYVSSSLPLAFDWLEEIVGSEFVASMARPEAVPA